MAFDDPATWHAAGAYHEHGGHRVFYRVAGSGDPVLLLHGFPTASWDWHRVWPALTADHRVIAPDFLGYGFSDKPKRHAYSLMDQTDRVIALLGSLDVDAVHVLAHDVGDTVAQELVARAAEDRLPFKLRSVCLLNGGLDPQAANLRPIQRLLLSPAGPLVARFIREATFRRSFARIFAPATRPSDEDLGHYWSIVSLDDGIALAPKLIQYVKERHANRDRWMGGLADTKVPLRFVAGLEDPVSGPDMVAAFRARVPDADVVELPGIGHYPQVEAPDAVLAAWRDLLARSWAAPRQQS